MAAILPHGYTFLNPSILISQSAHKVVSDLLEKASKRDPDAFGIYVYNDFYNYAILDLVDKTLSSLHSLIIKKKWDDAWAYTEALTIFLELENSWPMCDDGDRVSYTNKVYGASLITVIRALQAESRLDPTHIPNLDTVLRMAAQWGHAISRMGVDKTDYHCVCKGIGKRFFSGKEDELKALNQSRIEAWLEKLGVEERKEIRESIKEAEEEEEEDESTEPWYSGSDADEEDEDDNYILSRVWKEYKAYLAEVPTKPLRGPANWDISKWKKSDLQQFTMDGSDSEGGDF